MTDVILGPVKQVMSSVSNMDDIQMDTWECLRVEQTQRDEETFLEQLVHIDEQMGIDDLELLKFVCRDVIGVSKLESVKSALDIFLQLKKLALIKADDVDFLIECLGLIHRFDLMRLLGFDNIGDIKEGFSRFDKINLFRKLTLEVAEDLDDIELNKMKFLLSGTVRKKRLQEYKTGMDLFVHMEQENLLSHNKTELLVDMLTKIKRPDLVHKIQQYSGGPNCPPTDPSRRQNGPTGRHQLFQHNGVVQGCRAGNTAQQVPPFQHTVNVMSGVNQNSEPDISPVIRSQSAGTLSVSNSEGDSAGSDVTGQIPPTLIGEIIATIVEQDKWNDFAMGLDLSNAQIGEYVRNHDEVAVQTRKALEDWCSKIQNKGEIAPKLMYILESIDCKAVKEKLLKWQDENAGLQSSQNEGQVRVIATSFERPPNLFPQCGHDINFTVNRGEAPFIPAPPPESENECASLRPAQPMQQNNHPGGGLIQNDVQVSVLQTEMNAMNLGQNVIGQVNQTVFLSNHRANPPPVLSAAGVGYQQLQFAQPQGVNRDNPTPATDSSELPVYAMSKRPRGWCVIINNRDFHVVNSDSDSKEMPKRSGTDVDAESLQHVFEALGFIVRRRDNLTHTAMMQFLIDIAHNVDHTNFECFVCCILTHGVLNHLYGTNGKLISIKDLTSMFQANRCPSLTGKPKLFFLQACQGRDKMTGGEASQYRDIERDANSSLETDSDKEMIPNEADFVIGYATVPGYVSFRSRTHGSWYIRKLCELLEKLSHKEDLLSILVHVNNEVSKANASLPDGLFKQTPAPLVTLRKKLYFR